MKNDNLKRLHIWVMKPIQLMQKDEEGFISDTSFSITFEGDSSDSLKVRIYIAKDSPIFSLETDLYPLSIKKIGDGMEGADFFINLPENVHYPMVTDLCIKKEDYLSPIEVDYSIATTEIIKKKKPNYSKLSFDILVNHALEEIDGNNFSEKKADVDEMMKYVPKALRDLMDKFDDEKLTETRDYWQDNYDQYKSGANGNGERRKAIMAVCEIIISHIEYEMTVREETKRNKALESMNLSELIEAQKTAINNQDFELAGKIKQMISVFEEPSSEKSNQN